MSNREPISTVVVNLSDNAVHSIYIPLSDYLSSSVQIIMSDGGTTDDITVHAFLTNDTAGNSVAEWTPADDIVFGTNTSTTGIVNSAAAINQIHLLDTRVVAEKLKITYQRTAGAANDGDITIRVKRG